MSTVAALSTSPILIGIGANLGRRGASTPQRTCEAALSAMAAARIRIVCRSRWYRSAPVPRSLQPWFVNGVAVVETRLPPLELLHRLQAIERRFGRWRGRANAARTLDLDLLAYGSRVVEGHDVLLPHPRMHERAFVLVPLREVAPRWRHPIFGETAGELVATLAPGQRLHPLEVRLGNSSTHHIFRGIQEP